MAKESVTPDPMSTPIMSTPIGDGVALAARSNVDPRLAYDDLRQWIEEARRLGEIKEVKNLSFERDIGMVAEMALHDDAAACFIFEDVPGTIKGSRVLPHCFGRDSHN